MARPDLQAGQRPPEVKDSTCGEDIGCSSAGVDAQRSKASVGLRSENMLLNHIPHTYPMAAGESDWQKSLRSGCLRCAGEGRIVPL